MCLCVRVTLCLLSVFDARIHFGLPLCDVVLCFCAWLFGLFCTYVYVGAGVRA